MRFLFVDMKRAFTERSFIISTLAGIICMIASLIYVYNFKELENSSLFIMSHGLIMPFIAPFLASVAYSSMNMIERRTKFDRFIYTRESSRGYEIRRYMVNGIVSGFVLAIPTIVLFIMCVFIGNGIDLSVVNATNTIAGIDAANNISIIILLNFIFGFAFGSVSYALTFMNKKRYIPIVAPQVIYLLMIYAMPNLNLQGFYPPLMYSPWIMPMYADKNNIAVVLFTMIILSLIITLIFKAKAYFEYVKAGGR